MRGDIKRLMIFMPPRHGKSELASRRFPAFVLGNNPDRSLIGASYNSDLASDFGREVRNIVASPEYANVFETRLSRDSAAAGRWHVDNGEGGYVAAGIGTAVTGRGAHIFTIDDPVKDQKEAESLNTQINTYNWYTSTAYTRLESDLVNSPLEDDWLWDVSGAMQGGIIKPFNGAIILIMTRWHELDLAGRLLEDMEKGADQWDVLDLSAITEKNGKQYALWSEKYPIDRLLDIKRAVGARVWSSLYQQSPQPEEGIYFKKYWFNRYKHQPEIVNIYGTSDYAVTDNDGDYTEHTIWGVDENDDIYMLDNWSGQKTADVWIDAKLDLVEKWKPICWYGEGGVIRRAIEPFLTKRMRERNIYVTMEWINPIANKSIRARAFQGRASQGKIYMPEGELGDRCIDQLIRFPTGKNDDFVDTASAIGMAVDGIFGAIPTNTNMNKPVSRYSKAFGKGDGSSNWKSS